ncbi:cytochrome C nitrite reductase [Sphingomonas sp.]|uniref:cytochrome C nitrite reductase n=1 Tax=Sphingomonas sp. TaxID=28214 RepID=UPI001E01010F|nr:cytochrome C nitrite reductase [Sphingomonas sp.]MBX9797346.1 cytochrome C nitrite reductase [Sphingomonas sp.]
MRRLAILAALLACGAQAGAPPARPVLKSKAIDYPQDRVTLPESPANDLITQNCTGCHSVEFLTAQPPLDAKKWAGVLAKMRKVYHAPIDPADDARLVEALGTLPGQAPAH